QYEDEESGLYYNRFRYYNPESAQYISPDPIGLMGGFNPYSYVHNPTGYIDPFGLAGKDCPEKNVNTKVKPHINKAIKEVLAGNDVTVRSFKDADQILYGAYPKTRKVSGAGEKSPLKTSRQKKEFKLRESERGNTAVYHKDYQFNENKVLTGHEGLPDGHLYERIP
ncbi:RHS repeat-associated core domain-containing protein, partial [Xenorhabdus szentirmaii]|uniref:RHS repeat-associated core domain-containing protein n=1 Tax=Xenorhabdus szentirmaii TaxID=290112 RepID=UPI002B4099C3